MEAVVEQVVAVQQ
jgi:hypothetical protein